MGVRLTLLMFIILWMIPSAVFITIQTFVIGFTRDKTFADPDIILDSIEDLSKLVNNGTQSNKVRSNISIEDESLTSLFKTKNLYNFILCQILWLPIFLLSVVIILAIMIVICISCRWWKRKGEANNIIYRAIDKKMRPNIIYEFLMGHQRIIKLSNVNYMENDLEGIQEADDEEEVSSHSSFYEHDAPARDRMSIRI